MYIFKRLYIKYCDLHKTGLMPLGDMFHQNRLLVVILDGDLNFQQRYDESTSTSTDDHSVHVHTLVTKVIE